MNAKTVILVVIAILIGYVVGMKKPGIIPMPGM